MISINEETQNHQREMITRDRRVKTQIGVVSQYGFSRHKDAEDQITQADLTKHKNNSIAKIPPIPRNKATITTRKTIGSHASVAHVKIIQRRSAKLVLIA